MYTFKKFGLVMVIGLMSVGFSLGVTLTGIAAEPLVIALDQDNKPYSFGTPEQAQGLYVTIVTAIFREIGQPVTLAAYPWKRVLMMIDRGEVGAAGIFKNAERVLKYDYSSPYFEEKLQLFVLPGKEFRFATVADLAGKRVGVLAGWSHGDEFDNARQQNLFHVAEAKKIVSLIKLLELGEIDTFIAIPESVAFTKQAERLQTQLSVLEPPVIANPVHVAFARSQNQQALLEKINAAIQKLRQNGELNTILATFNQAK